MYDVRNWKNKMLAGPDGLDINTPDASTLGQWSPTMQEKKLVQEPRMLPRIPSL
jgi:hypothetical protein